MEDFVKTLKEWRAKKGLSQSQAAKVLGVPIKTLQNWEIARNKPGSLALEALERKMR